MSCRNDLWLVSWGGMSFANTFDVAELGSSISRANRQRQCGFVGPLIVQAIGDTTDTRLSMLLLCFYTNWIVPKLLRIWAQTDLCLVPFLESKYNNFDNDAVFSNLDGMNRSIAHSIIGTHWLCTAQIKCVTLNVILSSRAHSVARASSYSPPRNWPPGLLNRPMIDQRPYWLAG